VSRGLVGSVLRSGGGLLVMGILEEVDDVPGLDAALFGNRVEYSRCSFFHQLMLTMEDVRLLMARS